MRNFGETFGSIERRIGLEKPELEYKETERNGWKDSTIEHPDMPKGGRDFASYKKVFDLDAETLRNKIVLDLGAGPEAKLAHDLREQQITEKTISLSPDYSLEKSQKKVLAKNPEATAVAGIGQALPFAEKSIDIILAYHVHEHISFDAQFQMLQEMARVLTVDGQAHMAPAWLRDNEKKELEENEELQHYFASVGVTMSIRCIPKEVISYRRRIDISSSSLELTPAPYDIVLSKGLAPVAGR